MAMINNEAAPVRQRAGVRRAKNELPRIDMTPMVDLGFLLITFFIFTTEMTKPVYMPLVMPFDEPGSPTTSGETGSLTVLLRGNNSVLYYHGSFKDAGKNNAVYESSFAPDGIRKVIQQKQQMLDQVKYQNKGRDALVLIIKPDHNSSYKNAVDMLDEVTINGVKTYAFAELDSDEKEWLEKH